MATNLVSGGTIKSGYLRLSGTSDAMELSAGHFGRGATAATDLVRSLVRDAYGEGAARVLEDYLTRSRGGNVGTHSFVKLVRDLEDSQLHQSVRTARIKGDAKLRLSDQQKASVGESYRFNSELVEKIKIHLSAVGAKAESLTNELGDPTREVDGPLLDDARRVAKDLNHQITLLEMSPDTLSLPGASSVKEGLLRSLADLQFGMALTLISRNQLDLPPEEQSKEINQEEVSEARRLIAEVERHAKELGDTDLAVSARHELENYIEYEPVRAEGMTDSDMNDSAWQSMIQKFRYNDKTGMEPPEMRGGHDGYQSVSEFLARQGDASQASSPVVEREVLATQSVGKQVVSPANLNAWLGEDLISRLRDLKCDSLEAAVRLLGPGAETIVDLSYEDNEQAVEFLKQGAGLVRADLSQRLVDAPALEFDDHATGAVLKNIDEVLDDLFSLKTLPPEHYLTVSILLNMRQN